MVLTIKCVLFEVMVKHQGQTKEAGTTRKHEPLIRNQVVAKKTDNAHNIKAPFLAKTNSTSSSLLVHITRVVWSHVIKHLVISKKSSTHSIPTSHKVI